MSVGIGKYFNKTKLEEMATTGHRTKNTVIVDNFAQLTNPATQRSIFEQFCGAHVKYEVRRKKWLLLSIKK